MVCRSSSARPWCTRARSWPPAAASGSLDEVDAVRAALAGAARAGRLPDLAELVPAARTVLAAVRPGSAGLAALREVLAGVDLNAAVGRDSREVVLPVHYDGPDLALV